MTLLLLLVACKHAAPPAVFPVAQPPLTHPERHEATRVGDECQAPASFVPGRAAPYVQLDDEGRPVATCRGLVVSDAEHTELLADLESGRYWRDRASLCHEGRGQDRSYAQGLHDSCWERWRAADEEARRLRWLLPVAGLGGAGVGAALTLGILKAVQLTVE